MGLFDYIEFITTLYSPPDNDNHYFNTFFIPYILNQNLCILEDVPVLEKE